MKGKYEKDITLEGLSVLDFKYLKWIWVQARKKRKYKI